MKKPLTAGYKNPPKASQFKKGESGNPKGRPKGAKNLSTDLAEEMHSTIRIVVNGRPRTITKQRAAIKRLVADALSGNTRALGLLLGLGATIEAAAENEGVCQPETEEDVAILRRHLAQAIRKSKRGGTR